MTILGIGVDLVHIPRIVALVRRRGTHRFITRILSPVELSHWQSLSEDSAAIERFRFLAVRWCVKEAAYKAMYPTFQPTWKELSYVNTISSQKPSLLYHPLKTESPEPLSNIHVSVSHDGDYVFASVLIEV
ncbi:hypothetical protein AMATHDRAFT_142672 [Amanita thiersii Skay4041]|uniref:4'-phosphopantetheinyl transferase domain-containing protein n=1 Tax=Amanita thiersii Skay4041 TaxID=703135 RepID=A0A2A9NUK0_9AGAR|nr:hypothetical protein AMATHDRAFT_142672 [Amanita thiersii Skay4041]